MSEWRYVYEPEPDALYGPCLYCDRDFPVDAVLPHVEEVHSDEWVAAPEEPLPAGWRREDIEP